MMLALAPAVFNHIVQSVPVYLYIDHWILPADLNSWTEREICHISSLFL